MQHHEFAHALLQQRTRRMPQRDGVQLAARFAQLEPSDLAGLVFVDDEVIGELERGLDNLGEAIAVFAHDIHAGFHSRRHRRRQQLGRLGAELRVLRVERIEQQQVAEMKMLRLDFCEIQIAAGPECVGTAQVKESPPAAGLLGHHVGERGHRLRGDAEVFGIKLVLLAIGEDGRASGVVADESGGVEREARAAAREIEQHVVGRAAGARVLRADVGEALRARQCVNQLYVVNDPVATGQQAMPRGGRIGFHETFFPECYASERAMGRRAQAISGTESTLGRSLTLPPRLASRLQAVRHVHQPGRINAELQPRRKYARRAK